MRPHARLRGVGGATGRPPPTRPCASPSRRDLLLASTASIGVVDHNARAGGVGEAGQVKAAAVGAAPPAAVEAAPGVVAVPDARTFR